MESYASEEIGPRLAHRYYLLALFQSVFGNEPTEALLEQLIQPIAREALAFVPEGDGSAPTPGLAALTALAARVERTDGVDYAVAAGDSDRAVAFDTLGCAEMLDALNREYLQLFVGPGSIVAPPWESVYVDDRGLLFRECTAAVKRAYAAEGYRIEQAGKVADDALGFELEFMVQLAQQTCEAYEQGDAAEATRLLGAQKEFIDKHLLAWMKPFADRCVLLEGGMLYPPMARTLAAFVAEDGEVVDELLVSLTT